MPPRRAVKPHLRTVRCGNDGVLHLQVSCFLSHCTTMAWCRTCATSIVGCEAHQRHVCCVQSDDLQQAGRRDAPHPWRHHCRHRACPGCDSVQPGAVLGASPEHVICYRIGLIIMRVTGCHFQAGAAMITVVHMMSCKQRQSEAALRHGSLAHDRWSMPRSGQILP